MVLEPDRLEHLLRLARLGTEPGDIDALYRYLAALLCSMEALHHIAKNKAELHPWPTAASNRFRPDCIGPSLDPAAALHNAPQAQSGCFTVPRIFEG